MQLNAEAHHGKSPRLTSSPPTTSPRPSYGTPHLKFCFELSAPETFEIRQTNNRFEILILLRFEDKLEVSEEIMRLGIFWICENTV